jgi:hypothetical protein
MNAKRFQQVRTDIRHTIGRHTLALGLGLSILVVALAAQRYAAPRAEFVSSASRPATALVANQGWPGATLTGSAYSGQTLSSLRIAPATQHGWPGTTLMGSAYNGQ